MSEPITPAKRSQGTEAFDAIMLSQHDNVVINTITSAPTNGTSGTLAGQAAPGSLLIRTQGSSSNVYVNTNTQASPTWTALI